MTVGWTGALVQALRAGVTAVLACAAGSAMAGAAPERIRVGALAFGTVSWELAAMEAEGPSAAMEIVPTVLAGAEAAKIALQGDAVDVIVADWIWVARQRARGSDFTFAPYSTVHGALVVPANSTIKSVADLKGRRLGVVGGGLDKNWLMLKLLAKRTYQFDLERAAEPLFGAPPLLNEQLAQGRLDALLDYWHWAVKLEAKGYRTILDGRALLRELGEETDLANLGFVFRETWAKAHLSALAALLDRFGAAHKRICEEDDTWQRIVPLTREDDPAITGALRRRYCAGGTGAPVAGQSEAAARLFRLLREAAGDQLAGSSPTLPAGTFWVFPP